MAGSLPGLVSVPAEQSWRVAGESAGAPGPCPRTPSSRLLPAQLYNEEILTSSIAHVTPDARHRKSHIKIHEDAWRQYLHHGRHLPPHQLREEVSACGATG